jgi:hypothetical protein
MNKHTQTRTEDVLNALRAKRDEWRTMADASEDMLAALRIVKRYLRSKNFDPGNRDGIAAVVEAAIFKATGSDK